MKKSWNFWFENQVKLSKISGRLRPPNPPQVSLKISVEPLRPRGGLVVLENTVIVVASESSHPGFPEHSEAHKSLILKRQKTKSAFGARKLVPNHFPGFAHSFGTNFRWIE